MYARNMEDWSGLDTVQHIKRVHILLHRPYSEIYWTASDLSVWYEHLVMLHVFWAQNLAGAVWSRFWTVT